MSSAIVGGGGGYVGGGGGTVGPAAGSTSGSNVGGGSVYGMMPQQGTTPVPMIGRRRRDSMLGSHILDLLQSPHDIPTSPHQREPGIPGPTTPEGPGGMIPPGQTPGGGFPPVETPPWPGPIEGPGKPLPVPGGVTTPEGPGGMPPPFPPVTTPETPRPEGHRPVRRR